MKRSTEILTSHHGIFISLKLTTTDQTTIKLKSSKKKSPSAVKKSKSRTTKFNSVIFKIKSLHDFYPDMEFQLLKTKIRSTGPSIGWMKIDYGKFYEPKQLIALMKPDQETFKLEEHLNFFQNCQRFQIMWDWSSTNCEGKRIMSEVVGHLKKDMKEDDICCGDCEFNPNCFFLYGQLSRLSKDKG